MKKKKISKKMKKELRDAFVGMLAIMLEQLDALDVEKLPVIDINE